MSIPSLALRTSISVISEIVQIISGVVLMIPTRKQSEIRVGRIYNTRDVAELLGTSRRQIVQFIQAGELAARRVGDRYRISGESLVTFLAKSEQSGKKVRRAP